MNNESANPGPPLSALVIGVGTYEGHSMHDFDGPVADAQVVYDWLRINLRVDPKRITLLRNPTRAEIIEAFRNLQGDGKIYHGDAIFIYYAGLGCKINPPDGFDADSTPIEAIVPYDMSMGEHEDTVPPIPAFTINLLLKDLANQHGDNITVMLDCCYTHPTTTSADDKGFVRSIATMGCLPFDVDKDITEGRADLMRARKRFQDSDQSTHILLTACAPEGVAREEVSGHGLFTRRMLESLSPWNDQLTYKESIEKLQGRIDQSPQCLGRHIDRFLFNGLVPIQGPIFIPVLCTKDTYRLRAGLAQGITVGSEFTVHANPTIPAKNNPSLSRMIVTQQPDVAETILEPCGQLSLPQPIYALQTRFGEEQALRVHCTTALLDALGSGVVKAAMDGTFNSEVGFRLTNTESAHLIADLDGTGKERKAIFTHTLARTYGLERLPCDVPATDQHVLRVLRSIAHWNWHVMRANRDNKHTHPKWSSVALMSFWQAGDLFWSILSFLTLGKWRSRHSKDDDPPVTINFTRVARAAGASSGGIWQSDNKNLVRNGVVTVDYNPDDRFGIEVVNRTQHDLYASIFLLDNDQTIAPFYRGLTFPSPSLPAESSYTIGYGERNGKPLTTFLRDNQKVDVTFLKVFATTSPADFSQLGLQPSFHDHDGTIRGLKMTSHVSPQGPPIWSTYMVTLVVKPACDQGFFSKLYSMLRDT